MIGSFIDIDCQVGLFYPFLEICYGGSETLIPRGKNFRIEFNHFNFSADSQHEECRKRQPKGKQQKTKLKLFTSEAVPEQTSRLEQLSQEKGDWWTNEGGAEIFANEGARCRPFSHSWYQSWIIYHFWVRFWQNFNCVDFLAYFGHFSLL